MAAPSAGSVTFLFADIEGSTRLLARVGPRYPAMVEGYRAIVANAAADHDGAAMPMEGDACVATFASAIAAIAAAVAAQRRLGSQDLDGERIRARMGVHTGQAMVHHGEFFGLDLHRTARIGDAGHGGQIVVSEATHALVGDDLAPDIRLADLGLHRLKDLEAPLRLFQVQATGLDPEFPPLRTLRPEAHNLPAQVTSLVGRGAEVAAASRLVRRHRLVTVTGPGGIGKTRLAIHAGASLVNTFADGVWLVELTRAGDPEAVAALIAEVLRIDVSGSTDPAAVLGEALRVRATLLILDNFEHVIDAASVVSSLLAAAPDLHVLATSRERLLLTGEHVYEVPPLELGNGGGRSEHLMSDAVTLFVERARAHDPAFVPSEADLEDIAVICRLADRLPLGIELAAAQVRLFPVGVVRERMSAALDTLGGGPRDLPRRHRTMRDTIAWSYQLLPPEEQELFTRLSVFSGGRTLEGISAVCTEGLRLDPLAGVTALVDKSLLYRRVGDDGDVAFEMLQLVHDLASELLAESPTAEAVQRRHAQYFLDFAERADDGMLSDDAQAWERALKSGLGNLRRALTWAFEGGDPQLGVRLTAALNLFWYWGGPHNDGREWIRRAMASIDGTDELTRGRLHVAAGFFDYADGDMVAARRHWAPAVAAFRAAGDQARTCMALCWVAVTYAGDSPDHHKAHQLVEEAVALARRLPGRSRLLADALTSKGEIARLSGDDAAAGACYRQALALAETMGDEGYLAGLKTNLAYVLSHQGDSHAALDLSTQALEASAKLGRHMSVAWGLGDVAAPLLELGRAEPAARVVGASDAALSRMGIARQPPDQPEHDRTMRRLRAVLGQERLDELLGEGARLSLEEAVEHALASAHPGVAGM